MEKRQRLDQELVSRGMVATRARARDLIVRGNVCVAGDVTTKPSKMVSSEISLKVCGDGERYVSRGALKLKAGLDAFDFDVSRRVALDVGASTGGFTDVLLQAGVKKVYAVDVGRKQLAEKIRYNPSVVNMDETDARTLSREKILDPIGIIVADVSFISLTKALPQALSLAAPSCFLVALIKPQFEVGPERVGSGGIVRDQGAIESACHEIESWLDSLEGWRTTGIIPSPITGGSGNQEYLIGATFLGTG